MKNKYTILSRYTTIYLLLLIIFFLVNPLKADNDSFTIKINIPARKLFLLQNQKIFKEFSVGLGFKPFLTPIGNFKVESKDLSPGWIHPYTGQKIKPSANNPLGAYWIGFYTNSKGIEYGLHATNESNSIGKFSSHGCIRMNTEDIKQVFPLVQKGDNVQIIYERLELKEKDDFLLATIHADAYDIQNLTFEAIAEKVKLSYPKAKLRRTQIEELLEKTKFNSASGVIGTQK